MPSTKIMRPFILILTFCLQGCAVTSQDNEHASRMRACYEQTVAFENSDFCFTRDEFTHSRCQGNIGCGRDFWKAFSDCRQEVGTKMANEMINELVNQLGSSTALFVSSNNDLRGVEVDSLVDSLLIADIRPTKLLIEEVGSPCDLVLVNRVRGN